MYWRALGLKIGIFRFKKSKRPVCNSFCTMISFSSKIDHLQFKRLRKYCLYVFGAEGLPFSTAVSVIFVKKKKSRYHFHWKLAIYNLKDYKNTVYTFSAPRGNLSALLHVSFLFKKKSLIFWCMTQPSTFVKTCLIS